MGASSCTPSILGPDRSTFFLAIGTAYAVLSNPEKRKQYDQFGDDKNQAARHGHGHRDFHRGFEADISPEDLFNMFFGGGFPSSKCPRCPHSQASLVVMVGDWMPASPVPSSPTPDSVPLTPQVTSMSIATAACATRTIKGRTAGRTRVM